MQLQLRQLKIGILISRWTINCIRELEFWNKNLQHRNSRLISDKTNKKSNFIVCSDASGTGCGAHLDPNGAQICHEQWFDNEKAKSST